MRLKPTADDITALERALAADPNSSVARVSLADALVARGSLAEATTHYEIALAREPTQVNWLCNLAALLNASRRYAEAVDQCEKALVIDADCAPALYNQGIGLIALDEARRAQERLARCARLMPADPRVHTGLGLALAADWQFEAAISAYDRALAVQPGYARALNNRGLAKLKLQRFESALEDFDRVLAQRPAHVAALMNRKIALRHLGRYDESHACARNLYLQAPHADEAAGVYHMAAQEIAEWSDYEDRIAAIVEGVRAGRRPANPHAFLNVVDSPQDQLQCSRAYARTLGEPAPLWRGDAYRHDRLRVGYLSSDFHDHATAYLMAGLFERHDRLRFECFGLAYGEQKPAEDGMRRRLIAAFEHFHDLGGRSPHELAQRARELEIDVLVDLKGYTAGTRVQILAYRPAPVQVHYLGYPGTLGAPCVDYLIADCRVIPEDLLPHYAERIVWMPHCYQATDDARMVEDRRWTRAQAGLPSEGLVLGALHQTYKLNPPLFDAWMRLLKGLPGAILWLLAHSPAVPPRLASNAAARGVDPSRLVFAPKIAQTEHLARLRLADLFLDTWPVNAHTTASDALWVGVPVVALRGRAFAARVSGSVLEAAGLPELIAGSLPEYEELVLRLGSQPDRLALLRARVETRVRQSPLFDTAGFTRDLESAYLKMWDRHQAGLPPAHIEIERHRPYSGVV